MIFAHLMKAFQEQAIGHLHDVRFVHTGNLLAVLTQSKVKGEMRNPRRSLLSNDL